MYLHNRLMPYFTHHAPLFDQVMSLTGECYRQLEGRTTYKVTLGGQHYFIKQHRGVGWKEIVKNLLQGRWPVLGASNEWLALNKLDQLGVRAPKPLGFAKRGLNPATQHSFVIMQALTDVVSLETYCANWQTKPPYVHEKRRLIRAVAEIAATLHQNGINHRDFYLCHFMLEQTSWDSMSKDGKPKLFLIDLHRAQLRRLTPRRWIIKDLSGLYFSSKDMGLTRRDYYRFMMAYTGQPLRALWKANHSFWQKVKERGEHLYRHHHP